MILKFCIQHWGLKLNKICINGDPSLIFTDFTARSNLVNSTFKWENCCKNVNGKNLQQITKLTEDLHFYIHFEPQGLVAPAPVIYDHYFQTWPIKANFYVEPHWEKGT